MNINKATVLIVSDGRMGHVNQSLGVAKMLGFADPEVVTLTKTFPQRWLSWLPLGWRYDNLPALATSAQRADLLLGTGSGPTAVLRYLKKQQPRLFTVAILRPKGRLRDYDVVSVPQHDGFKPSDNLIATMGNPGLITQYVLAQEGQRWAKRLSHLRGFKLALLVGGPSRHGGLNSPAAIEELVSSLTKALKARHTEGASLLVTTSGRTTAAQRAALEAVLEQERVPFFLWHPGNPQARDNPYFALLHSCNAVVVTADSSSMVSDACASGKPTYLWAGSDKNSLVGQRLPKKFQRFYAALVKQGRAAWWDGTLALRPPAAPLMDTMLVAGFVRARWHKRFGLEQ